MATAFTGSPIWEARRWIAAIALLIAGGFGIREAAHEPRQQTLGYAQFARTLPAGGWFTIEGARYDLSGAVPTTDDRGQRWYLVPVYDATDAAHAHPSALVGYTSVMPATPDDAVDGVLLTNVLERPDHWDTDRTRFGNRIAPDARVFLIGGKPDRTLFTILFVAGIVLGIFLLLDVIGSIALRRDRRSQRA